MHRYRDKILLRNETAQAQLPTNVARNVPKPPAPAPPVASSSRNTDPAPALGYDNLEQRAALVNVLSTDVEEPEIAHGGFMRSVEAEFAAYCDLLPAGVSQLKQYTDVDLQLLDFWEVRRFSANAGKH